MTQLNATVSLPKIKKGSKGKKGKSPSGSKKASSKPSKSGKKSKSNPNASNLRKADAVIGKLIKAEVDNARLQSLTSNTSEEGEDILVPVNPLLLFQYVASVIMSPMALTDDQKAAQTAAGLVGTIMINFIEFQEVFANVAMPRAIVRLRKALEARRIGKYNYIPDWSALTNWITTPTNGFSSAAFQANSLGFDYAFPNSIVSAGFYSGTYAYNSFSSGEQAEIPRFLNMFSSYYDPIVVGDYVDNRLDASAFAWDISPVSETTIGSLTIGSFCGYTSDNGSLLIRQNGIYALETRVGRPDLASLRLGTPVIAVNTSSRFSSTTIDRRPNHNGESLGAPSVMGWCSRKKGLRGKILCKPVPVASTISAIAQRLEALASALGSTFLTQWKLQTANSVKLLAFSLFKNYAKQYSGAFVGTRLVRYATSSSTLNVITPMNPEFHAGSFSVAALRVPEFVGKLLGSISPSSDRSGVLIPWLANFNPTNVSLSLTGYATETIVIPAGTDGSTCYTLLWPLISAYKKFEPSMATMENMMMFGAVGPSNLDTTILINDAGNVSAIVSRRPITDPMYYRYLTALPSLTYDYVEFTNQMFPGYAGSRSNHSHVYSQKFRRDLAGIDSLSSYGSAFVNEGIVLNGFTGNIAGSNTSGNINNSVPSPVQSPLTLKGPVPLEIRKYVYGLASKLVPRKGNYCGPGWTAGFDITQRDPILSADGKYLVPPTDREDAICKAHDEAYAGSKVPEDYVRADKQMVRALEDLEDVSGLSVYGHAAKLAIYIKSRAGIASNKEEL